VCFSPLTGEIEMPGDFITENFLLSCPPAVELYHRFAKEMPIFDYHCHLPPQGIITNGD
jgi:glucuronate isomerase